MSTQRSASPRIPLVCLVVLLMCGLSAPALALDAPHNSTNNIGCNNCHATHGFFGIMPRGQLQADQCKTCHKIDGQANARPSLYEVGDHIHGNFDTDHGVDCGVCHDPHSAMTSTDAHNGDLEAPNRKLVRSDPQKYIPGALPQLVYQTAPDHYQFQTAPYNALCQTCHTDTTSRPGTPWHKNNGTGKAHESTGDCLTCHTHSSSFAVAGGCKSCHNEGVGAGDHRRQIVEDAGSGGDFSNTALSAAGGTTDTVRDEFATVSYANNNGTASWVGNWVDPEDSDPAAGNVQVTVGEELRFSGGTGATTDTVRDEFSTQTFSNNNGTASWTTDWLDSETDGPTAGNVQVTAAAPDYQLRLNSPTGGTPPGWTQLTYDDFEAGWGNYTSGGADAILYTGGIFAHEADNAAQIQDRNGTASSFAYTNPIDVDGPGYTEITVSFWYWPEGMQRNNSFSLEYWDGATWQTVRTWVESTDFTNGAFYQGSATIQEGTYTFPTDMSIRFSCDGRNASAQVYIDEIDVQAYHPGTGASPPDVAREANLSGGISSATFTFDYSSANAEAGDDIVVEVSNNGGGDYVELETIAGGGAGSKSYDILAYAASNTRVRFRVASGAYNEAGEYFYVDNVQIEHVTPPTGGTPSAAREADLTGGITSATFTFDYRSENAAAGDDMLVEVSSNGGGAYTPLETIAGGGTGSKSYNILSYAAVNTRIRLSVSSGYDSAGKYFYVDNVQVRYVTPGTGPAPDPSFHVTDGTGNEVVQDGDCAVCHDGGGHKTLASPTVKLKNPDGGTPITYDGTGASTTTFCVNCHDADGPTAVGIFSDGNTPPNIADNWSTCSHSTAAALTAEGCMACHGGPDSTRSGLTNLQNAHGSNQPSILSTTIAGETISNGEEGVCLVCHDSNGPATTDINTVFARTYHHPIDNADPNRTGDGRDPECAVCHNAHALDASNPHTTGSAISGRLKGVSGADASGSFVSQIANEYELCFKCHGSYAGAGNNPGDGGPGSPNIATQFTTATTTFHPVLQTQDNTYCNATTMELPWDDTHRTMWCSDCHKGSGTGGPHGSTSPKLLVGGLSAVDTLSPGKFYTPLCINCHKLSSYVTGNTGSKFSAHNNSNHVGEADYTRASDGKVVYGGCLTCHYGGGPEVPMNSVHGGTDPAGFVKGNSIVSFTFDGTCVAVNGGGSTCKGHSKTY